MSGLTFIGFKTVQHGVQAVSSVSRIALELEADVVSDGGDGQAGPTIVECVSHRVTGRIELADVEDWESLLAAPENDLAFVGEAAGSGTDQTVRIKNVTFGRGRGDWRDGRPPLAGEFVLSFAARFDSEDAATLQEILTIQDV